MAVAAKVPEVLARVKDFKQDLSRKLHIIQGNEYERMVFEDLRSSLPEGEFLEFSAGNQSHENTISALKRGVPIVAQAKFTHQFGEFEWMGFSDLLVREDFELHVDSVGKLSANQVSFGAGGSTDRPFRYVVWDVKHAKKESPKYWKQIAGYVEVLQLEGLASSRPVGVILAGRSMVRREVFLALQEMRDSRELLFKTMSLVTPDSIDDSFAPVQPCSSAAQCKEVYCSYPDLCSKIRYDQDSLEQLPGGLPQQRAAFIAAGISTTADLAKWEASVGIAGLSQSVVDKYVDWSKVIQAQRSDGAYVKVVASPSRCGLPALDTGDLFFDIEWFNPLEGDELIFMFGYVDSAGDFGYFLADNSTEERAAFEGFVKFATEKFASHPEGHIFHYSDPEPSKLRKLSAKFGVLGNEVDALASRMVDLRTVAKASIMPGCAGYSIKQLEQYYKADSVLQRGDQVKGGEDAMYQYFEYLQLLSTGQSEEAREVMKVILDYNRDDCLSTKLLAEWMSKLSQE
jgi:uncharacterized protein